MIVFWTWHVKVKQHDYWMLLVSIGYTILIYIGHIYWLHWLLFQWLSALLYWDWLLRTRLDALGFTFFKIFFWSKIIASQPRAIRVQFGGKSWCDPLEIWFRVAEWLLRGFRPQSHGVTKTEWLELMVMLTQAIAACHVFFPHPVNFEWTNPPGYV